MADRSTTCLTCWNFLFLFFCNKIKLKTLNRKGKLYLKYKLGTKTISVNTIYLMFKHNISYMMYESNFINIYYHIRSYIKLTKCSLTSVFLLLFCSRSKFMSNVANAIGEITGPKYDGKYIRALVKMQLRNLTVKQTLTDVVIPTFDIRRLQPIIFSSSQVHTCQHSHYYL